VRTRAVLSSVFASLGVLAVGWQLGAASMAQTAAPTTTSAGTGTTPSASTPTTTSTANPSATASPSATATTAAASSDGTWTGSSVNTRFGSVQVSVTISGGQITEVTPLHLTDADGRSVQISNQAAPMIRKEVLAAQSAQVSNIGGATYTTQAYLQSLQSALDQAGF
jgi:uncharacterized protein with FMN-binding domain